MTTGAAVPLQQMRIPTLRELALLPVRSESSTADEIEIGGHALTFNAVDEPEPGEHWQRAFSGMWPAYRAWYLQEGDCARPDLATCRSMLEKWMPELVPTFETLTMLAGGDPLAARFLSMYRPPGFVVGCSQAAFTGDGGPILVRNYDYPASRAEGIVYSTAWTGRRVIGMSDCLWGLLDGVNDGGLAVSLTFGGRRAVGEGFGIPLVIRYVLEVCENVADGCSVLAQVPVHAAQNVTLLDRDGDFATVRLSPDRAPEILTVPVATNHQHLGDWPDYARAVDTFERERRLLALLRTPAMTGQKLVRAFLEPPLYRTGFASGLGTLYTAIYTPATGRAQYLWPGHSIVQSFEHFVERRHIQRYTDAGSDSKQATTL
jgi:predicted choloylglycine hydrolase